MVTKRTLRDALKAALEAIVARPNKEAIEDAKALLDKINSEGAK